MIPVIWSSQVAAAVVKPAGLATQSPAPYRSLETLLRVQFADHADYLAFPHRLDRPVSGLVLVAFTKRAARLLGEQFAARRISKTYLALVTGSVEVDSAIWTDALRKIDNEPRVAIVSSAAVSVKPDVKLAESQMRVIDRFGDRSLIELRPTTGRMHQLRVQTASRGHAIIGDRLYGSLQSCDGLAEDAIALQASQLSFNDPTSGLRITVDAPRPDWYSNPDRVR